MPIAMRHKLKSAKLSAAFMALLCTSLFATIAAATTLQSGFVETTIQSPRSNGSWSAAVGITFSETGRMFVWERGGRVWIVDEDNPVITPFIDINEEVLGWRDHGFLGFTLHDDFDHTGYVYLLYTVDRNHLMNCDSHGSGTTPPFEGEPVCGPGYIAADTWEPNKQYLDPPANSRPNPGWKKATIGRVIRLQAMMPDGDSDYRRATTVDYASRRVLLGETWEGQPKNEGAMLTHESHGIGTLTFGGDGTLIASVGDNASYTSTDTGSAGETYYDSALADGIMQPKENIGALRSQLVDSLPGKILRLDPETGNGLLSNPFYDPGDPRSARSRVYALGLRNPFRIHYKADTGLSDPALGDAGTFYIGDVGWGTWEDLHVLRAAGQNFGWPLYEGMNLHSGYNNRTIENLDAPNPLADGGCPDFFRFRDLLKQETANTLSFPNPCDTAQQIPATVDVFEHSRPMIEWRHGGTPEAHWGSFDSSGDAVRVNIGDSYDGRSVLGTQFNGNSSTGGTFYYGIDFPTQYKDTYFHGDYGAQWIKNIVVDQNDVLLEVRDFASNAGGVVALATHPQAGSLYYIAWASFLRKISYPTGLPDTTPPTDPTNLVAVAFSDTRIDLAWTGSMDDVDLLGYHVYQGSDTTNPIATVTIGTTYSVTNLSPATSYDFHVRAVDVADNQSGLSNVASAMTMDPDLEAPSDPTNLAATAINNTEIGLQWTASTDNIAVTGYIVYQDSDYGNPVTTVTSGTSYTVTNLQSSTGYDFEVRALDAAGNPSGLSNLASATTSGPDVTAPTDPTNLIATTISDTQVSLQWTGSIDNVAVTGYPVYQDSDYANPVATVTSGTSYTITNLDSETAYDFEVRAIDAAGNPSGLSNLASATTSGPDVTAPTDPMNLRATTLNDTHINLIWTASTDDIGVAGYDVFQDSNYATPIVTVPGTSYPVMNLDPDTSYSFEVQARDAAGNPSGLSNAAQATTLPTLTLTTVPVVANLLQADAESAIVTAGLVMGTVTSQGSPSVPPGAAISASPVAGTPLAIGSTVDLMVSSNQIPALTPIGTQTVVAGGSLTININAVDGDAGDTLTIGATPALPYGVFTDNGDGTASWVLTPGTGDVGNFPAQVTVMDDGTPAATTQEVFWLQVVDGSGILGLVKDSVTLQPIQDAQVTLQATNTKILTAADGSFTLNMGAGSGLVIVGAKKGYYSRALTTDSPAAGAEILLDPVHIGTNSAYAFVDPNQCAQCHPNQKSEWDNSAMANAGLNTWVHDIFAGNGTEGGMGSFVYTRDSVHAASVPDADCAACHQAESWVSAGYSGRLEGPDDIGYPSPAAAHGVSCEVCHKLADVDTTKFNFPGIFPGSMTFVLPDEGDQVMYGLLPDVSYRVNPTMEPSMQPQLAAEICGVCHQDNTDVNVDHTFTGVVSEPTYNEWAQSPYADPTSPLYQSCIDCHMPPSGLTALCTFAPVLRDPSTVRTHAIEGTTPAFLDTAVELSIQTQLVGNELQVDVTIDNSLTGHSVPTGVTIRNMILLVEAWEDGQDPLINPLVYTGTQTIHELGGIGDPAQGYYAGLPGKLFAKVSHDVNLQAPAFFTDATGDVFDNRIPALAQDDTSYTFAVPNGTGTVQVRARLIYRRAFRALVDAKGWTETGHGAPLEDLIGPDYGHLMEVATETCGDCDPPDSDADGIPDAVDNCPLAPNGPLNPDPEGGADQQDDDADDVGNACDLLVDTTWLPAAKVGTSYSQPLTAVRGLPPYTWSLIGGFLPADLTLGSDGVIGGDVIAGGFTATFTAEVMDSTGDTATQVLKIRARIPGCYSCHAEIKNRH